MVDALMREFSESELQDYVARGREQWQERWELIRKWRNLRYMKDDVKSLIPDDLRTTDYEYHDDTFNKACFQLASFLSAAEPVFTVDPPSDAKKAAADDIENVLTAVFEPGGVLDQESNGRVPFMVWQNQGENGHGIYKLVLKRDYPLALPQRLYSDDNKSADGKVEFEENESYAPRSQKDGRVDRGTTKYRESDESLKKRRAEFIAEEFPFQWSHVDPTLYFEFTQDDVPIIAGEISARPATVLTEHGLGALEKDKKFIYLGTAVSRDAPGGKSTPKTWLVDTFELWTPQYGYFGFLAKDPDANGKRRIEWSKGDDWRWVNTQRRLPYFSAYGMPSTEEDNAGKLHGVFDSLIAETGLLNYLETMHFNAGHRQHFPFYQAVRDGNSPGDSPLNSEQQQIVSQDRAQQIDLPPGWKWEVVPTGTDVNLFQQLVACRERIKDNALAAVLTGSSPGAGDSGAKISLLINAATRAMSPLVRFHEVPFAAMARCMLDTAKRLRLELRVDTVVTKQDSGESTVKQFVLKPDNIVTTKIKCTFDVALPVDQAARETRGMALRQSGNASYEHVAPRFFGVRDVQNEKNRIALDRFEPQAQQIAFGLAVKLVTEDAPEIFQDIIGALIPPPEPPPTVGGGPEGAYGGASAELGRGTMGLEGGGSQIDNNMMQATRRVTS